MRRSRRTRRRAEISKPPLRNEHSRLDMAWCKGPCGHRGEGLQWKEAGHPRLIEQKARARNDSGAVYIVSTPHWQNHLLPRKASPLLQPRKSIPYLWSPLMWEITLHTVPISHPFQTSHTHGLHLSTQSNPPTQPPTQQFPPLRLLSLPPTPRIPDTSPPPRKPACVCRRARLPLASNRQNLARGGRRCRRW